MELGYFSPNHHCDRYIRYLCEFAKLKVVEYDFGIGHSSAKDLKLSGNQDQISIESLKGYDPLQKYMASNVDQIKADAQRIMRKEGLE